MTEHSLGARIPDPDDAVAVGRDDGGGARRENGFGKQFREIHFLLICSVPCGRFHHWPSFRQGLPLRAASQLHGYAKAGVRLRLDGLG
jgi:hypothetical protein